MEAATGADATGISQPYLCQLETGKRALSPRTARHLAEVLGVSVPLPLIDPAQTATGRRESRELDHRRVEQLYEELRKVEAQEQVGRLAQQLSSGFAVRTFRRRF